MASKIVNKKRWGCRGQSVRSRQDSVQRVLIETFCRYSREWFYESFGNREFQTVVALALLEELALRVAQPAGGLTAHVHPVSHKDCAANFAEHILRSVFSSMPPEVIIFPMRCPLAANLFIVFVRCLLESWSTVFRSGLVHLGWGNSIGWFWWSVCQC